MLTVDEIKRAVTKVGKQYGIRSAYLFGSYAKGTATEKSDVDLIVDDGGKIKGYIAFNGFRFDLADELGTDVDILTPASMGERFYNLIKDDRVLIYGG